VSGLWVWCFVVHSHFANHRRDFEFAMPPPALRGAGLSLLTRPSRAAQKLRVAILKELEHIQTAGPGTNELARFEKVEKLMET
jgi:hypothetical protein